MRRLTFWTLIISLLLMSLAPACSKKETGPPPTPAAEIPKDGVSSIPEPAERATDMSPVDLPLAGEVKEVKAKVLDKEADDKTKGLLHIKVLALDGPVDVSDNTRVEVWKPGSDPEEQKPEMSDWASHEPQVPVGTWDLRLHYEEGQLCKADGWIKNVTFTAGKLWKAEAVLAAPMNTFASSARSTEKMSPTICTSIYSRPAPTLRSFSPSPAFGALRSNRLPPAPTTFAFPTTRIM